MYLLQNEEGQIQEAHSISAGLDYPGVGPEHSLLKDIGRVSYHSITDEEALEAFQLLTKRRYYPGVRKLACCRIRIKISSKMKEDEGLVICLSGRGDKDVESIKRYMEEV